jgi:uncharacterized protein (TIRG00374 family)
MLRNKSLWIGIIISLALLVFAFKDTNFNEIANVFRSVNYIYLIPALVLYFAGVGLRAVRWHFLLRSIKPIAYGRLLQITIIGYMANDLLPFRIGELVRAYLLGETEGVSKASVLVTIVLERVFDGITMLLFIGTASIFLPLDDYVRTPLIITSILVAVIVFVLVVVARFRDRFDGLIHFILSRLPGHWYDHALKLLDSFFHGLSALHNPLDALAALVFSIGAWLLEATMYAVLGVAFGLAVQPPVYLLTTALANLFASIPSTPGYVGVFDAPVITVLSSFGVNANVAASYTILLHITLVVPVVIIGLVLLGRLGLSLGQLQKRSQGSVSLENA